MRTVSTLLPLLLGSYYVFVTEATTRSKTVVAALLCVSLTPMFAVPVYLHWALLLQISGGVYIAFYLSLKR